MTEDLNARLPVSLEHALVRLQRLVQPRAELTELEFEPDFAVGASVCVFAPDVFGIVEREAARIGPRSRPDVIIGCGEVLGLLKLSRCVASHVARQLLAVMQVRVFEVAIAINAVEVEIAEFHGPDQVFGPHDLVEKLARLRCVQHRGVRLNRAM